MHMRAHRPRVGSAIKFYSVTARSIGLRRLPWQSSEVIFESGYRYMTQTFHHTAGTVRARNRCPDFATRPQRARFYTRKSAVKGLGGTFHFPFLKVSIGEMGFPVRLVHAC